MTPRTTARPMIVRTMLPPPALWAAALAGSSAEPRFSLVFSPSAAKAAGAVSRQPRTAAGEMAWRVRISYRGIEPGSGSRLVSAGGWANLNVDLRAIGSGHAVPCRPRVYLMGCGDGYDVAFPPSVPSDLSARAREAGIGAGTAG